MERQIDDFRYATILGHYQHFIEGRIYLHLQGFEGTQISLFWKVPEHTQRNLERQRFNGWKIHFTSPQSFTLSRC